MPKAEDPADSEINPDILLTEVDRPSAKIYVRTTLLIVLLWIVAAGVLASRYVDSRLEGRVAEARRTLSREMTDIHTGLSRNLEVFHGVPAVIARDGTVISALRTAAARRPARATSASQAELRASWAKIPAYAAANESLAIATEDIPALSVLWIMDRSGDCVAASNHAAAESFIGYNYGDRTYFRDAMNGKQGNQFAVGRASNVPGLYFSAPVYDGGRIVGVAAGKLELAYLSTWVNQANAFISDIYGVVVQAQDARLIMRALPDASVRKLSPEERLARYRLSEIPELSIESWNRPPTPGFFSLQGGDTPLLLAFRPLTGDGLTVTVLEAVPEIATRAFDRRRLHALLAAAGTVTVALVSAALFYFNNRRSVRNFLKHRRDIEYMAMHDMLTGLLSRAVIDPMIRQGIAIATRSGKRMAVLFLDLDLFKDINDSMGHETGDLVLKEVAKRLRGAVRASDPVIRHGGDEFVILLNDLDGPDDAARLSGKILASLKAPYTVSGVALHLSASVGVALFPEDGRSPSVLLRNADSALFRRKERGRGDYSFYHASMNADTMAHLAMEAELRNAIESKQFVLHYQPQYSHSRRAIIGCEALVRWQHPERGLLPPDQFIASLEKTGLITRLGQWVIKEACRQAMSWREAGLEDLPVSVNISAHQFREPGLVDYVRTTLSENGLPPSGLELELTESALMENTDEALATMQELKTIGVSLSIDDFGTGYSSLSYLKRFELDTLKIDQSFVRDVETDPNDRAIVEAIIGLARTLGYHVIAEGLETEAQLRKLVTLGCDAFQGYWCSGPLPPEAFAKFVASRRADADPA